MSMNEMEAKVSELRELRRMADDLAAEIGALEDDLKAYMAANNADELQGPEDSCPGTVGAVHQDGHHPALYPGMRKAPCISSRN